METSNIEPPVSSCPTTAKNILCNKRCDSNVIIETENYKTYCLDCYRKSTSIRNLLVCYPRCNQCNEIVSDRAILISFNHNIYCRQCMEYIVKYR